MKYEDMKSDLQKYVNMETYKKACRSWRFPALLIVLAILIPALGYAEFTTYWYILVAALLIWLVAAAFMAEKWRKGDSDGYSDSRQGKRKREREAQK